MTTKNHRDEVVTDPNRPVASERRPYLEPSRSPPHEPRLAAWETPVRLPAAEGVWRLALYCRTSFDPDYARSAQK